MLDQNILRLVYHEKRTPHLRTVHATYTRFTLLGTFGPDVAANTGDAQPLGPGTVWGGVATGWHRAADALEGIFDNTVVTPDWRDLTASDDTYLLDQMRLIDMVQPA